MRKEQDQEAGVEAAKKRLKAFIKRASEVNYHDAARMKRYQLGNPDAPHRLNWAELARRSRIR